MKDYHSDNVLDQNIDQKLDLIDDIESKAYITNEELEIIDVLSYDPDDEVRARVADIIKDSNTDLAREILMRLTNDKDSLVRANACDSLCNNKSSKTLELLKSKVLKDRCSLVRGYATLSIVDIIVNNGYDKQEMIEFFFDRLKKEKIVWVKICIYKGLYLMGHNEFLDLLLQELNNRAYRNRCMVTNILFDIISEENYEVIRKALIQREKKEKTVAVTSTIENVLNNISI